LLTLLADLAAAKLLPKSALSLLDTRTGAAIYEGVRLQFKAEKKSTQHKRTSEVS
jgi:hypothetical protein